MAVYWWVLFECIWLCLLVGFVWVYLAVFTGGCCLSVFGCVYWLMLFECIWLCLLVGVV